jgi:pimeloyl-ACP methyl ester carboxylesterase
MSFASILLGIVVAAVAVAVLMLTVAVLRTRRIASLAERLVPASGKFVTIDGNRIHYVEKGEGRPILFVHGLGAQLHQFRSTLFDKLDDYRLIAVDRPGSGYSERAAGATGGLSEQALVVRRFIEALGLKKPLVVGHSLGGAVALTLAIEHPESISGLALLAPYTYHSGAIAPEFSALYIPSPLKRRLISETVAVPAARKYADQTLAFVFGPQPAPADYMTESGGWAGLRPSHFYATSTDIVAIGNDYPRLQKRFGEIKVPVGILFGTADRVLDYQKHGVEMVGRIADLDLELAEGIGHMPQFSAAEQTTAFIKRMAERAFRE